MPTCLYVRASAFWYTSHSFSNRSLSFVYAHPTIIPFNAVTPTAAYLRVHSLLHSYIHMYVCIYACVYLYKLIGSKSSLLFTDLHIYK